MHHQICKYYTYLWKDFLASGIHSYDLEKMCPLCCPNFIFSNHLSAWYSNYWEHCMKHLTTTVHLLLFFYNSEKFYFIYLEHIYLSTYMFEIVKSSWWIVLFYYWVVINFTTNNDFFSSKAYLICNCKSNINYFLVILAWCVQCVHVCICVFSVYFLLTITCHYILCLL